MIKNLYDLFGLIDSYSLYLTNAGIGLSQEGLPKFSPSHFLDAFPEDVVTYKERNSELVRNPKRTVICFYCPDKQIYPRLERVLQDIPEYQRFQGVIATDVTVTCDMDLEWQKATMLINQLFIGVLAVNGVKVVANLRCGLPETLGCFEHIPRGVTCASGLLGCRPTRNKFDLSYSEKLMRVMPSRVLLYGRNDPIVMDQINTLGIPCRRYPDVHSRHRATAKRQR